MRTKGFSLLLSCSFSITHHPSPFTPRTDRNYPHGYRHTGGARELQRARLGRLCAPRAAAAAVERASERSGARGWQRSACISNTERTLQEPRDGVLRVHNRAANEHIGYAREPWQAHKRRIVYVMVTIFADMPAGTCSYRLFSETMPSEPCVARCGRYYSKDQLLVGPGLIFHNTVVLNR